MPLSRVATLACCGALLVVLLADAPPAQAGKAVDRHYPINKWCSIVSGYASAVDLTTPYVFTTPAGRTRVMITFTATNVTGTEWSNQRLDDVVVLPAANLPAGTEPLCFNQQLSGALAARPPAYPGVGVASLFRDDFQAGARPEWGTVPSETPPPDGNAPASVYWTAVGSQPVTEVLYESFDDAQAQGFTLSTAAGQNLWRATSECGPPAFGAGQLAFTGTSPGCTYTDGVYDASIVSPVLNLAGATSARLQYRHRWNTDQDGTCIVESSLDGSIWTPLDSNSGFGSWVNKEQFLPTGAGTSAFRFRFRFTATAGSGEGCFFDDVSVMTVSSATPNGALALGRSLHVNGDDAQPFIDAAPVVARLNLTGLTPSTSYAVMARWNSAVGSNDVAALEPTRLIVNHVFDPLLSSPTHTPSVWSRTAQVTIQWSGAVSTDENNAVNLAGYSTVFDTVAATSPDTTVDTVHGTDPHSFTSAVLADGGNYYFHLRTCDTAQNCTAANHFGPFQIDRTAPTAPVTVSSTSHTVGASSFDRTIDMSWSGATDALSGVDGYGFVFDNTPTWTCDQVKDVEESVTTTTSATLALGTWYFHVCTRDNAGNWSGSATAGPYTIVADTTPPTNPTLSSTTHTVNVWSSARQVTVRWSGSTDAGGSGVAGYSTVLDSAAATSPDTTLETPHTTDPHSFTSASLADGGSYYFHLRACDVALNCSTAVHLGPFRIDGTAPTTPTNVTSSSHTVGVSSTDATIDVSWTASTDASSGVDGYAFAFDGSPTWTCDQTKDVEETVTSATSSTLAPGDWYFHVCARDNAGNWSSSATSGPYTVSGPSGSRHLYTLAPCRLFDTRNASGAPPLNAGADRVFSATAAPCGVPATAQALSVNVTVVGSTAPGHLTLYPLGAPLPTTSTINYGLGQTRANNAILPLGAGAQFAVHSGQVTGTVHLIVDVNGYFE